jgi:hypothetical protein
MDEVSTRSAETIWGLLKDHAVQIYATDKKGIPRLNLTEEIRGILDDYEDMRSRLKSKETK